MSTHGCLRIRAHGERRSILLNTTHSAYLIREIVAEAPARHAVAKLRQIIDPGDPNLRAKYAALAHAPLAEWLERFAFHDGFDWPPSIAAMCIAARPGVLVQIPKLFERDLAEWSGLAAPARLVIHSTHLWHLTIGGEIEEIHPWQAAIEAIWHELHPEGCEAAAGAETAPPEENP